MEPRKDCIMYNWATNSCCCVDKHGNSVECTPECEAYKKAHSILTRADYGKSCANCGHYFPEKSICTLQNPPEKIKQPAFCPACDDWEERQIWRKEDYPECGNCRAFGDECHEQDEHHTICEMFEQEQEDTPESPVHYKQGGIECIDAIRAALGDDFTGFCVGNVMKYVWRFRHKNGKEDLKKAAVYLQWAIESLANKE